MSERQFMHTSTGAGREPVQLLVGCIGPSFSGKTFSALRLATGMQRVLNGPIFMIDTENRRGKHYQELFRFEHVEFREPFGSLDYLQAIQYCVLQGAKILVIDSMSHEHEGAGGCLEAHERELDKLCKDAPEKREKLNFAAWIKPKADRTRLIQTILQLPISVIFCFRAEEKLKLERGRNPSDLGFVAVAGKEFPYEMTVSFLLPPGSGGVPQWESPLLGERQMIKVPVHFRSWLTSHKGPLDEDVGERLAQWAAGDVGSAAGIFQRRLDEASTADAVTVLARQIKAARDRGALTEQEFDELINAGKKRRSGLGDNHERQPGEAVLHCGSSKILR